jgi:protein-tyrosine phosphatase
MESEYIGAVKIKDGLFMGDKDSSQDLDFLVSSKVTHIINTCSTEVNNEWTSIGIAYLSLPWADSTDQILFPEPITFQACYCFIDTCIENGESVLIHSVKGESRCVCLVLAYLMKKYKWALTKSLEFLNSRKPDCKIKPQFLFQLVKLENSLALEMGQNLSKLWDETEDSEEILLRNTYLNSRPGTFVQQEGSKGSRKIKLKWADGGKFDRNKLEMPARKKSGDGGILIKSCFKGREEGKEIEEETVVKVSKSVNTLAVKNFSDSAKEYGSFDEFKHKRPIRTNSVSKRENSPLLREFKKSVMKIKKKIPTFALFGFVDTNKNVKKENGQKRTGSARPASPYVKKDLKEPQTKIQLLKPTWKC